MDKVKIESAISNKVLVLAEEFRGDVKGGGIASVLKYYRPYFEQFKFIPTFKTRDFTDKLYYVGTSEIRLYFKLLFDKQIEIIHFHVAADGSFWQNTRLLKIAKSFNKKVIFHIHASRFEDFYKESSSFIKNKIIDSLTLVDIVMVLSKSWKDFFVSIGISEDKIKILNNITEEPRLPINKHTSFPLQLLFLGEIGERKGVFELIKALSLKQEFFREKVRLIIGGNKNEDELCELIAELGVEDFVEFKGFVAGELKYSLLSTTDIFCLPSKNEGMPISILEAMSYECAILSSPVGGIPEIIKDNVNGILVNPYDIEDISIGLESMLSISKIKDMGQKNGQIITSYYPQNVITSLRNIYLQLLKK